MTQNIVRIVGSFNSYADLQNAISSGILYDKYQEFTTTAQYVGRYVSVSGTLTLVTDLNKDTLSITPGTTKAYDVLTPASGVGYTCLNPGTVSGTLYPPGNYAYNGSVWFRVADKLFDSTYSMGFTGTTSAGGIDKREWLPCTPLPHRTFFLSTDDGGTMSVYNGTGWTEIE